MASRIHLKFSGNILAATGFPAVGLLKKCMVHFDPQTTKRGPLDPAQMDPAQHSDSCKSETKNDLAEIFQVIAWVSTLTNVSFKRDCGVQWTPVESEMGVIFLGSMKVNGRSLSRFILRKFLEN